MKQKQLLQHCSIVIAVSTCFCACIKPGGTIPNADYYRVDSLITNNDTGKVAYNAKGDPISITFHHPGTSAPNCIFWYDQQGRLTDEIGAYAYPNNSFDTWHRYVYDQHSSVPKADTVFEFGEVGPHGPLPDNRGKLPIRFLITFDKFDALHRISKVTINNVGHIRVFNYYYNAEGNAWKITEENSYETTTYAKATPTPTIYYPAYDNKVNIRQLHPTWQLSDLNYSRNNPFTASSYNIYGLPLQIIGQYYDRAMLGTMFLNMQVKYRH